MDGPGEGDRPWLLLCMTSKKGIGVGGSALVPADDVQHLVKAVFHLAHQSELGAGTVQIVAVSYTHLTLPTK